ncbi:MAG: hypothetical protein NXI04_18365 [Planctomycetaceae bacterium]|nr:hypothetical protein [Planctomycetaceae bacterium]
MAATVQKLKRIKARLSGDTEPTVEIPFELGCECNARVVGVRRSSPIQVDCEVCGSVLYVLPVNVYPSTPSVPSEVIGGSFSYRLRTVVGELVFGGRREAASKQAASKQAATASETKAGRGGDAAADSAAADSAEEADVQAGGLVARLKAIRPPQIDVRRIARATFTPFRLVMVAMICVVGSTGYFLSQQQSREAARQTWLDSADRISQLLGEGDLVALQACLEEAVAAGETLGKSDREWRYVQNLLRESEAANTLAAVDLLTAFQEAYNEEGQLTSGAAGLLEYAAGSGVYVFDSWILPDYISPGAFRCELPAAPGRHLVDAVLPVPALSEFLGDRKETRCLFAASIRRVQQPSAATGDAWRLELDPRTFVLISTAEVAAAVGFDSERDERLQQLLSEQDEFVRTSEAWSDRQAMSADAQSASSPEENP